MNTWTSLWTFLFGRLNILRKPQKSHTVWNAYFCALEPMVVSNPFPYCTYIYELCTYEKNNEVKLKMFVSFINEIGSLSSIIIRNLCTYSKYLQTYYGIEFKISSIKTNVIFKTIMYETSALDCKISFEVHDKCFMWVLRKIKITHVIYALDLQLNWPIIIT